MPSDQETISWWTPLWGRERQSRRFRHELIGDWALWQIALIAATIAALSFIRPLRRLVDAAIWKIGFVALSLVFGGWLGMFVPRRAKIDQTRIQVPRGFQRINVRKSSVTLIRLVVFDRDRILLKVRYNNGAESCSVSVAVDPRVDLQQLSETLPFEPSVRDARERYRRRVGRTGQRDF